MVFLYSEFLQIQEILSTYAEIAPNQLAVSMFNIWGDTLGGALAVVHQLSWILFNFLPRTSQYVPPSPLAGSLIPLNNRTWIAKAALGTTSLEFVFPIGPVFVLSKSEGQYVLPSNASLAPLEGYGTVWILPESPTSEVPAYMLSADADIFVTFDNVSACTVTLHASTANITAHESRPHADIFGDEFILEFPHAEILADALAGFYWGTMLPCVVEKTTAANYPVSDGFIISTLADTYAGTYPDVDHEFQIKGRIAMGSMMDLAVVRRIIELDLKLMREDPQQLWRAPCSLQPSGSREFHIRRNSEDGETNANMFLVTGNVELMESVWLYVARTKDLSWLLHNIDDIENASWLVEWHIDTLGRLWSDVYYEDQVMKDGRETMTAALAARGFGLLAQLEHLLGRNDKEARYLALEQKLMQTLAQPLPIGYWDSDNSRFVDWVDRSGLMHDHVHLLANVLPVIFGATQPAQTKSVLSLVDSQLGEFQRFPTFLAAQIAEYTESEIGDGGPYDLCAAGRYWAWDAAFWHWRQDGEMLQHQLAQVAAEGRADNYVMGERYDMDYIYYVDGVDWHGAPHYYEYPCVYAWVLVHEYLGLRPALNAALEIAPRLVEFGSITLKQKAYQVKYDYQGSGFDLSNLATSQRSFALDLSALYPTAANISWIIANETVTGPLRGSQVSLEGGSMVEIKPLY